MAAALVGADLDLAPDVGGDGAAQVALGLVVRLDVIAKRNASCSSVSWWTRMSPLRPVAARVSAARVRPMRGYVGECDLEALLARQIDPNEERAMRFPFSSGRGVGPVRGGVWRDASPRRLGVGPGLRPGVAAGLLRLVRSRSSVGPPRHQATGAVDGAPSGAAARCGADQVSPGAACAAGCRRSPSRDRAGE